MECKTESQSLKFKSTQCLHSAYVLLLQGTDSCTCAFEQDQQAVQPLESIQTEDRARRELLAATLSIPEEPDKELADPTPPTKPRSRRRSGSHKDGSRRRSEGSAAAPRGADAGAGAAASGDHSRRRRRSSGGSSSRPAKVTESVPLERLIDHDTARRQQVGSRGRSSRQAGGVPEQQDVPVAQSALSAGLQRADLTQGQA